MAHNFKSTFHLRGSILSDTTVLNNKSSGSSNPYLKEEELDQICEDADKVAEAFVAELKRCAAEDRARNTLRLSAVTTHAFNPTELNRIAESAAADAAKIQQMRRGNKLEDDIVFAEEVQKSAFEARAARSLASEVRRVSNKSSRLNTEVAALQKVVQTPIHFRTPPVSDVIEWRAEAAQIEEKITILRKKLDNMRVPSQFSLQKRHEECMALKSELSAAQNRLKPCNHLPPSLAEAAQKLQEAREQLNSLRREIRNCNARKFGLAY